MSATTFDDFVRALPKVELHVNLIGSATPETWATLAAEATDPDVPTRPEEIRRLCEFRSLTHFIEVYKRLATLVRTEEHIAALVTGLARDLSRHNVRYAEVRVSPYLHRLQGMADEVLAAGLAAGRQRAATQSGVTVAWIFDVPGEYGVTAGMETIRFVREQKPADLVGFSLSGIEETASRRDFGPVFTEARELGLHSVPCAGEATGSATVWAALRSLDAERIGHGTSAATDRRLIDYLGEFMIPLEMCPSSNVRTRTVRCLAEHPVRQLIAQGLMITINTDDPPLFDTDLTEEYLRVARVADLDAREVARLASNSVSASFLDGWSKALLLDQIADALQVQLAGAH